MLDALAAEELDELEAQTRHSMSSSKLSDVSIVGADVILRLIAQARAARPSPWQPMETAPKDTSILVSDGVDVWETHLGNLPYTSATTWQPLPAPPAQDGGTK